MPELCVVSSTIHMHKVKYKILEENLPDRKNTEL